MPRPLDDQIIVFPFQFGTGINDSLAEHGGGYFAVDYLARRIRMEDDRRHQPQVLSHTERLRNKCGILIDLDPIQKRRLGAKGLYVSNPLVFFPGEMEQEKARRRFPGILAGGCDENLSCHNNIPLYNPTVYSLVYSYFVAIQQTNGAII